MDKALGDRRRHPRWRSERAYVYLYARGQRPQRCRVLSVSKVGVFLEVDPTLEVYRGQTLELAFSRQYTKQVIKLYRRSAYITRVSRDGVAVLFFAKRRIQMMRSA